MTDTKIRIASYNIRKARGLDQLRKPERTLAVINQLGADIVVLQEADRRLGPRHPAIPRKMIETETDFQLVEVSANGVSLGCHGNAVLVRDLSKVMAMTRIDLPGLEPRGAVAVDLNVGSGLRIVAAHLGLRRRNRREQFQVMRDKTEGCTNAVIAGDFNEWSQDAGMEALEGHFSVHSPGRTFHASRPVAALDRFALSQRLELAQAGVVEDGLAKIASDHLPIWSDVIIPATHTTY